ncbi:hypothetical protein [Negadavirga shengliensis]|uniref:Uncharacterized protein n=1 Tax=Negadavirga shengliensis TaxID=1389218 RepID=A0ABV9SYI9_9BACT
MSKPARPAQRIGDKKEQKSRRVIENKYLTLCQRLSDPMTVAFIPPPQSPFTDIEIGTGSERGEEGFLEWKNPFYREKWR